MPKSVNLNDVQDPRQLLRLLQERDREVEVLRQQVDQLRQQVDHLPSTVTAAELQQIRAALEAGGAAPLNLTGLIGLDTTTQFAVSSTSLDTSSSPYSVYVLTGSPDTLIVLDRSTTPPTSHIIGQAPTSFSSAITFSSNIVKTGGNGSQVAWKSVSEEITLSTVALATDSAANLLPGFSLIRGVVAYVTTGVTGPTTTIAIGDASSSSRFGTLGSVAAGSGLVGLNHWQGSVAADINGPVQVTAAKLRLTANALPTAGKVRVVVFYEEYTAPTS